MTDATRPPRFEPTVPLDGSVTLLEASAGTGKTYSITTLYVRLVAEEGVTVDRILVVTFTEAATAELRERVRSRLRETLEALERAAADGRVPEDPLHAHLASDVAQPVLGLRIERVRAALEGFDQAEISTIHGFCRRMLQQNAFESGVEFDADLIEDSGPMLQEIVEDFWTRETWGRPEFLVRHLAMDGIAGLIRLARRAGEDPDVVLVPPPGPDADVDDRDWRAAVEALRQAWAAGRDRAIAKIQAALDARALKRTLYRADKTGPRADELAAWLGAPGAADESRALTYFSAGELARNATAGNPPQDAVFDGCRDVLDARARLGVALDAFVLGLRHRLVAHVRLELARRKALAHQRSFDDLLRLLREGLRGPSGQGLRTAIRKRYDAALIDEFQDTDPVQWDIFRSIFADGGGRLFLIGDPKQAIYAFRRADVFTYLAASQRADRRYTLDLNRRSDGRFVQAINALFEPLREPFVYPGIDYVHADVPDNQGDDRLIWPDGPHAPMRVVFLPREPSPAGKPTPKGRLWPQIPRLVAADIAHFLEGGPRIVEGDLAGIAGDRGTRPVRPGDVAVLVRKNEQARQVQRALREVGVPAVLHGAESVLLSGEAGDLSRVLGALVDPTDGAIRAALATPLLGMTATALAGLEGDATAWGEWADRVRRWGATWVDHGFMRMFRGLAGELGLAERLLGWSDGERRLTNLLHLAELLHRAAVDGGLRPAGLLAWLRRERTGETPGDGDARQLRLESDADAVEIVTLHRCKGLQYPVVWCPYLWDGATLHQDEAAVPRYHVDGGVRLDIGTDKDDPDLATHRAAAEREARAEAIRLAYVALTRARHATTLFTGAFNGLETSPLAWLLHQERAGPAGGEARLDATSSRVDGLGDDALRADLARVEAASGGTIAIVDAPPAARRVPTTVPARPLATRDWRRRRIDTSWERSSFTRLAHGARDAGTPADGVDRDDLPPAVPTIVEAAARAIEPPLPLAGFGRGAQAGTLLHELLEKLDFATVDPSTLRDDAARAIVASGFDPAALDPLAAGVWAALHTPLGGPTGALRLRDLANGDRRAEMRFDLPVAGGLDARDDGPRLSLGAVARAMQANPGLPAGYADRLRRLPSNAFHGFLTGAIDLVFRHDGRWYLVDYKSNHLGDRPSDYGPDALAREMASRHYFLQSHLYAVALRRFLRWRLPAGAADAAFGGTYYLFLRGMTGPDATGGIWFDRPPDGVLQALDDAFERPGGGDA